MSDSKCDRYQFIEQHYQASVRKYICLDCAFHIITKGVIECIHPDEFAVNCSTVVFCNSFQPAQEIESPCVSFDYDD